MRSEIVSCSEIAFWGCGHFGLFSLGKAIAQRRNSFWAQKYFQGAVNKHSKAAVHVFACGDWVGGLFVILDILLREMCLRVWLSESQPGSALCQLDVCGFCVYVGSAPFPSSFQKYFLNSL